MLFLPHSKSRLRIYFPPVSGPGRGLFKAEVSRVSASGFTLIELLIAVTIGSVIIAALYATFFSVVGVGAGAGDRLERSIAAGRFLDLFSRDIEGAYFDKDKKYTGLHGTITGTSSVMLVSTFTYPVISEGPANDLVMVRYHVEESKGAKSFSIYKESYNPYFLNEKKFNVELLGNVESFKISYLNGKRWTAVWSSAGNKPLPKAVRVELVLDTGERFSGTYRTRIR